jgi:tetratricopeptide (TPR) repeat protein
LDYIKLIALPNLRDAGPYHDDYVISRGLFKPWSTAPALLSVSLSIIASLWLRKRIPLISFAVLWFFAGHLLESTFLPLEIYFEHRNYLPMLGFYITSSYYIINYKGKLKGFVLFLTFLYLSMEAAISYSAAKVWGDEAFFAINWAEEHPYSVRAQLDALRYGTQQKNITMVRRYIDTLIQKNPNDSAAITLPYLFYRCSKNQDINEPFEFDEFIGKITRSDFSYGMVDSIRYLRKTLDKSECDVTFDEVITVINATLTNPAFNNIAEVKSILYTELASAYKKQGNLNDTILSMDQAYEAMPKYEYCLSQANWLFSAGLYEDTKFYLKKARNTPYTSIYERLWKSDHISAAEKSFNIKAIQQ